MPSAALPGTDNVVLFGERATAPYLVEPLSRVDVPASLTADGGRPPLGVLDRVRPAAPPHAALEAWRRRAVPLRRAELGGVAQAA